MAAEVMRQPRECSGADIPHGELAGYLQDLGGRIYSQGSGTTVSCYFAIFELFRQIIVQCGMMSLHHFSVI